MGGQILWALADLLERPSSLHSATSCHMLDKILVMPSSGKLRVEDLEGKKYFIVQFPFRGHVVPQKPLSLGTFPSMTGKSGMGGSGADVCVGQPHGAVDGKSVLLPASPMASTVSNTFSWRGKLSLMMPSSCKQTLLLLMDQVDNSLTMLRSCLLVFPLLPLTVISTGIAPMTVSGLLSEQYRVMSDLISSLPGIFNYLRVSVPPKSTVQPVSATLSVFRLGDLFKVSCFGILATSSGRHSQTGNESTLDLLNGLWIHSLDGL